MGENNGVDTVGRGEFEEMKGMISQIMIMIGAGNVGDTHAEASTGVRSEFRSLMDVMFKGFEELKIVVGGLNAEMVGLKAKVEGSRVGGSKVEHPVTKSKGAVPKVSKVKVGRIPEPILNSTAVSDVGDDGEVFDGDAGDNGLGWTLVDSKRKRRRRSSDPGSPKEKVPNVKSNFEGMGTLVREVPKLNKFNIESGHSWEGFLTKLEHICRMRFPNSRDLWTSELGRHLEGSILRMYESFGGQDEVYDVMKGKLTGWVVAVKEANRYHMGQFHVARKRDGETISEYAARLETLYRRENPGMDYNRSDELLKKFLETVERSVAEDLRQRIDIAKSFTGRPMTWTAVMNHLFSREAERAGHDRVRDYQTVDQRATMMEQTGGGSHRCFVCGCHERRLGTYADIIRQESIGGRRDAEEHRGGGARGPLRGFQGSYGPPQGQRYPGYQNRVVSGNRPAGRPIICFYCGKQGHMQSSCNLRGLTCFTCGERGHKASDCSRRKGDRGGCYVCGTRGHIARDCSQGVNRRGPSNTGSGSGVAAALVNVKCPRCSGDHLGKDCRAEGSAPVANDNTQGN